MALWRPRRGFESRPRPLIFFFGAYYRFRLKEEMILNLRFVGELVKSDQQHRSEADRHVAQVRDVERKKNASFNGDGR